MKTSMQYDVVIIGGGLVGASLAAALKDSGLSLALVEAGAYPHSNPSPAQGAGANDSLREASLDDDWDSRIYAISPGSRRFLEQSGAWSQLDKSRVAAVEEMRVFGDPNPSTMLMTGSKLEFSAYQMGVAELACILENRALQHALWQVLQQQDNLAILQPARCAALTLSDQAAELTLEDGRTLTAKLIVGADGRDSWVRNQAGISAAPVDYQQHGVVANFSCTLRHRGIAHQWFQPDGILALLPLPGNRVSMVWSVSPDRSKELLALSAEQLCAQVSAASQHTLGDMQLITPAAAFPLRLLTLPQISANRVALIGDAAHNMHPLAGQGVNTGFRDARQLAKLLIDRGGCSDCGDAQLLRRYDRKRREDIYTMQATTYGLKNLFCNDDPLLRTLRNVGLNATNQIAPLKKLLMQHALN
ncbi:MAG: UbiH/UbiF family hydroxylase [Gallionella sp.]|jgi:ubiquinone biosynthesis UbiH/UbiF/VisC/COQ6 family hydroxylase